MKTKNIISYALIAGVLLIGIFSYTVYQKFFQPNTNFSDKELAVFIQSDASFDDVKKVISPLLKDWDNFETVAAQKKYTTNIRAGKFILRHGMNNNDIISALRNPVPVMVTFNNQERLEDLAKRIDEQMEMTEAQFMKSFTDSTFLAENGLTRQNVLSICLPNTYEFFWNEDPDKFRNRMNKEFIRYWNEERVKKAEAQGLTPLEAIALASIVHKETVKVDERPKVAGVYLNRLKRGMKLEADPTVIYGVKEQSGDFNQVIKRVLYRDLAVDSKYNTYMYAGLPPGPIAMPDLSAIEAVLNPETHEYIYFCASVTRFGYHEFARTASEHEVNRQKYVKWIAAQGVNR